MHLESFKSINSTEINEIVCVHANSGESSNFTNKVKNALINLLSMLR